MTVANVPSEKSKSPRKVIYSVRNPTKRDTLFKAMSNGIAKRERPAGRPACPSDGPRGAEGRARGQEVLRRGFGLCLL